MIYETAQIVAMNGNELLLETQRQSTCSSCSAKKACGVAALQRFYNDKKTPRHQIRLPFTALDKLPGAQVGDLVRLGINDEALITGSLWLYGLPILGLILAAGLGSAWFGEAAAVLSGLAGFFVSLFWVRQRSRRPAAIHRYQPQLLSLMD